MSCDFSISIEPLRLSAFYDVIKSSTAPIGSYDNLSFFNSFSSCYISNLSNFPDVILPNIPLIGLLQTTG